jgi:hypothetical protein
LPACTGTLLEHTAVGDGRSVDPEGRGTLAAVDIPAGAEIPLTDAYYVAGLVPPDLCGTDEYVAVEDDTNGYFHVGGTSAYLLNSPFNCKSNQVGNAQFCTTVWGGYIYLAVKITRYVRC